MEPTVRAKNTEEKIPRKDLKDHTISTIAVKVLSTVKHVVPVQFRRVES